MKRFASSIILAVCYSVTLFVAKIAAGGRRRQNLQRRGILVIGTFHNPNWVVAHIIPLRDAGLGELVVVADDDLHVEGITVLKPPRWLSRIISRAAAKFFVALRAALTSKPGLVVGYHIFPAALSALAIGSIVGSPTCYQVTSGSLELDGGGWHSENVVLKSLGRANSFIHSLVLAVVKQFELIVVRGSGAETFLRENGVTAQIVTITGSVEYPETIPEYTDRDLDVLFVGRLTEYKRPDRFIAVMARLFKNNPNIKIAMIGDGPDRAELEEEVRRQNMTGAVSFLGQRQDVISWHKRARVFVLTSRWEGVSIALLEAMACGAVPVVSDVGDMKDFVRNDDTGYILPEDNLDGIAKHIEVVLADEAKWRKLSENCRYATRNNVTSHKIAAKWALAMQLVNESA